MILLRLSSICNEAGITAKVLAGVTVHSGGVTGITTADHAASREVLPPPHLHQGGGCAEVFRLLPRGDTLACATASLLCVFV